MIRLLRTLFEPRDPLSHHAHVHLDDDGHPVFCDESACRPANDPLLNRSPLLFPPYR